MSHFLGGDFKADLNRSNPLGMQVRGPQGWQLCGPRAWGRAAPSPAVPLLERPWLACRALQSLHSAASGLWSLARPSAPLARPGSRALHTPTRRASWRRRLAR